MLGYSVSYFLSQFWRNAPLYAEKLIPLLDTCLSNNFTYSGKVSEAFYELINKYQNTAELPLENLKEFIKEQGYGYILDLVKQDEENIKLLLYLLVLIHQLKGSEAGLKIVLSMFQEDFNPDDTVIRQWFQVLPVDTENTFEIESQVDIDRVGDNFFYNFRKFIRSYVYPELTRLKLNYTLRATQTQIPYTLVKLEYTAQSTIPDWS